jgi:hypothetical protein
MLPILSNNKNRKINKKTQKNKHERQEGVRRKEE